MAGFVNLPPSIVDGINVDLGGPYGIGSAPQEKADRGYFVASYDGDGKRQWIHFAKKFPTGGAGLTPRIAVDSAGDVYVIDDFFQVVDFEGEVFSVDLGNACAHALKQSVPELQIIMLTIEEDSERVFAALRAGASGYLLKTATPAQIVEAIALVAQGGSPMSATIARRVVESFHGVPERGAARQSLSPREIDVLEKIANGRRIKEAASDLNVSVTTVQSYLRRIFEKLQVNSQAEAVAKFLR